jgi:hypothetical protein
MAAVSNETSFWNMTLKIKYLYTIYMIPSLLDAVKIVDGSDERKKRHSNTKWR